MAPPEAAAEASTSAPATSPVPEPPPTPASAGGTACVLGAYDGIAAADATTSAALVCEALIEAGADVAPRPIAETDARGHAAAYRVDLRPLGTLIVLQVAYESPVGTRVQGRTLQLRGLEEVPVAAIRIAEALAHDKPLESTATVDTLVGQETRKYQKEYGETLFGFGVFGLAIPDDTFAGYGAFGRLYYESVDYAVGAELRGGGSSASNGDAHLVGVSVGARYFLTGGDITPFFGGGAGILWFGVEDQDYERTDLEPYDDDDYGDRSGSGLAPYAEFGVEFLRFHDSRFDLLLRVDVPIFELGEDGHEHYAMPISIMASYSID